MLASAELIHLVPGTLSMSREWIIRVSVAANLLLGIVWLAFVLVLLGIIAIGLGWFPNVPMPPTEELFFIIPGTLGMLLLYLPGLVAFFGAAIGLWKRASW